MCCGFTFRVQGFEFRVPQKIRVLLQNPDNPRRKEVFVAKETNLFVFLVGPHRVVETPSKSCLFFEKNVTTEPNTPRCRDRQRIGLFFRRLLQKKQTKVQGGEDS